VLSAGRLEGVVPRSEVDLTAIGMMMAGAARDRAPVNDRQDAMR
jgi:general nucleoside transport system ATP-binding protein